MKFGLGKTVLQATVGISILAVLLYYTGIQEVAEALSRIGLIDTVAVLIISLLSLILAALNLHILLRPIGAIPWQDMLRYTLLGWSLGNLLPARMGEFSVGVFLREKDIPLGPALMITLIDRLLSMLVLGLLAAAGAFRYLGAGPAAALGLISIGVIGTLVVLLLCKPLRQFVRGVLLRKHGHLLSGFSDTLASYLRNERLRLFANFCLTVVKYCTHVWTIQYLFYALGTPLPFTEVFWIHALVVIISLLPVGLNGIGVKEGAAVFLFTQVGAETEVTMSVYLLSLVLCYLQSILIFFYYRNALPSLRINSLNMHNQAPFTDRQSAVG